MKACPKCEHNNDEDTMYCSVCGTSLKTSKNFLNNVYQGKNNWWRYLITILSTVVVPFTTVFIAIIFLGFIFAIIMIKSGYMGSQLNEIFLNPIFLVFLTMVLYVFFWAVFYIFARFIHQRKLISFINTESKINWMKILKGAGLWIAILGLFTIISFLLDPGSYKFTFNPNSFWILLIICLIGIPIQASFEEVFFRGYLMQGFGLLSKKPIVPLLTTSILFAIIHCANGINSLVNIFLVLQIFVIGIMFGIIALGENRIETAIGVHIANNLYAFLIVSSSDELLTGLPSIFTLPPSTPSGLCMGLITTIIAALLAIIIIFWGKKDKLLAIFKWEDAEPN